MPRQQAARSGRSIPSLIDCWGDSLTAGAGSNGSGAGQGPWPKQLADRLGAVVSAVNNRGVGGQNSAEIEADTVAPRRSSP
jgi:lysophospholipase L1-like esterase